MTIAVIAAPLLGACDRDPPSSPVIEEQTGMSSFLTTAGSGPYLLETPENPDPDGTPSTYGQGCATSVNNEGVVVGTLNEFHRRTQAVRWDRSGRIIATCCGGYPEVLAINDRGDILILNWGVDPMYEGGFVGLWGKSNWLPERYIQRGDPTVWLSNRGDLMANYTRGPEEEDRPFLPYHYIVTCYPDSECKQLQAPLDPAGRQYFYPRTPQAQCSGEAIDALGRVYGTCSVNRKSVKYRWTSTGTPVKFGPGENGLDFWIEDVNRYSEIVGITDDSVAVYWSAERGKITIPVAPGEGKLRPITINDRGMVLLSTFHRWGPISQTPMIAYWTTSAGTVVIDKGPWLRANVYDMNNSGVIAGCVGDGTATWPALWRIQS